MGIGKGDVKAARYVIIGAGFAGAATAYHLARRGADGILVLEQEPTAGVHSSGRNAAMVRQIVSDEAVASLAREGAAFLLTLPDGWPTRVAFERTGSLLLASGERWPSLCSDAALAREAGVPVEVWSCAEARSRVPVLEGARCDGAIWCKSDGVVDIHALLEGYLRGAEGAGVQICYGCPVRGIGVEKGRVTSVVTEGGAIPTEVVVNAAGAWAEEVARMAGATAVPLCPCRRHLFTTGPLPWVDRGWPFVWDVENEIYFRPESGGLLLSPCDATEHPPGIPPTDPAVRELLAEKIGRHLPGLSNISIQAGWAGLRTLTPDGRFVIGWDPGIHGFFWVAGLGGHGVTTSGAVGALAARMILGETGERGNPFTPNCFWQKDSLSVSATLPQEKAGGTSPRFLRQTCPTNPILHFSKVIFAALSVRGSHVPCSFSHNFSRPFNPFRINLLQFSQECRSLALALLSC